MLTIAQAMIALERKVIYAPKGEKRKRERIAVMARCLDLANDLKNAQAVRMTEG